MAEIDARLEALQKDLLKKANAKKGFDDLAEEIETLRSEKETLLMEDANRVGMQQRLDELEAFLEEHQEPVTDYDEGLGRKLVARITVYADYLACEYISRLIKSYDKIVNQTFIRVMETLGYDVELTYIKRDSIKERP